MSRKRIVTARMSEEEWTATVNNASRFGLTVSDYIRIVCINCKEIVIKNEIIVSVENS